MANPSGFDWYEYTNLVSYGTFSPERLLPLNLTWNSNKGYGRIKTSGVPGSMTNYGFLRGGYRESDSFAGVLALRLDLDSQYSDSATGFRCAR